MPRFINPVPGFSYPPYGKLYFYKSGINSPLTTYKDDLETIANTNTVELDALGRVPNIFYTGKARVVLQDANNQQVWERDPVGGEGALGDFEVYDEIVVYNKDDIAKTALGVFYISLQDANQGNDPTLTPNANSFWMEVRFIDVYNSQKPYSTGDIVQSNEGYLWRSMVDANLSNEPTTDTGTNWLPALNGAKLPEVMALESSLGTFSANSVTVIPQTGGGVLTALRINEIQDGGAYTLPAASSISVNQTIQIDLPDAYKAFKPIISRSGSDTISYSGGTDTSITMDAGTSESITLTSDGVSDWEL